MKSFASSDPTQTAPSSPGARRFLGRRLRFNDWTIRARIAVTFAILVVFVLAQTALTVVLLKRTDRQIKQITSDALPGLIAMAEIQRNVGEIQIHVLRVFLASTPEEQQKHLDAIGATRTANDRLLKEYEGTITLPEDRQIFDQVVLARGEYAKIRSQVLALLQEGKREEAARLNAEALRPAFTKFNEHIGHSLKYNMQVAGQNGADISNGSLLALRGTVVAAIVVLVVSIGTATAIVIGLTRVLTGVATQLDEGSQQVAAASAQVSAASHSLAEGASEQAASLEETSSSLEEMSSMTQRNSETAKKASALARDARSAADAGSSDMQAMGAAMSALKTSSDDIAKIVKTIDEIAFQTNILALNAAVEAARAGTAGAGFAVVADEVRALAQRSAQAAKETATKIEGAIEKTNQGVEISEKVGASLSTIVAKVRDVDQLISEVSTASDEQSQGVVQINTAVSQMDKVVQGSASNAEETAAAAEELNNQAVAIRGSVQQLNQLVKGGAGQSSDAALRPKKDTRRPRDRGARKTSAVPSRNFLPSNKAVNGTPAVRPGAHSDESAPLTFRDM